MDLLPLAEKIRITRERAVYRDDCTGVDISKDYNVIALTGQNSYVYDCELIFTSSISCSMTDFKDYVIKQAHDRMVMCVYGDLRHSLYKIERLIMDGKNSEAVGVLREIGAAIEGRE